MKTVRYFETLFEADVALSILEGHGIKAIINNNTLLSVMPQMTSDASFYPYIVVAEEDFEMATKILTVYRESESKPDTQTCPNCNSTEIAFSYRGGTNKFVIAMRYFLIFLVLMGLSSVPRGQLTREYYCRKCKHQFNYEKRQLK